MDSGVPLPTIVEFWCLSLVQTIASAVIWSCTCCILFRRNHFIVILSICCLLIFFLPTLSQCFLRLRWEAVHTEHPQNHWILETTYSWYLKQSWDSVLSNSPGKRSFSDQGFRAAQVCGYKHKYWEGSLTAWPFSTTPVSSQQSLCSLSHGLLTKVQYQRWNHPVAWPWSESGQFPW